MADNIRLSISTMIQGKLARSSPLWKNYNNSFNPTEITITGHGELIQQGFATCPIVNGTRKQENFVSAQHIGLDFDTETEQSSLVFLAGDPFISEFGGLLHTSASHTPQKPRGRIYFYLDTPVTDPVEYRRYVFALLNRFSLADPSANDPARLFFGAPSCETVILNRFLPVELLKTWVVVEPDKETAEEIELPTDVIEAIILKLGAIRTGNSEWSQPILCPFHEDHNPSAVWNFDKKFLKCFACGENVYLAKQVAGKLGIVWPTRTIAVKSLPNSIREHLVQNNQVAFSRILDSLYFHGLAGQSLTVKEILEVVNVKRDTVLRFCHWIQELINQFDDYSIPPSISCNVLQMGTKFNSRGRKPLTIILPSTEQLCKMLGVKATASDPLPSDALLNKKNYRAAMHITLFKRRPGTYTAKWLQERLGIRNRVTVWRYEQSFKLAGNLTKELQVATVKELDGASFLPFDPNELKAHFIETSDGKRFTPTYAGLCYALEHNTEGAIVLKRKTGSLYRWQDSIEIEL